MREQQNLKRDPSLKVRVEQHPDSCEQIHVGPFWGHQEKLSTSSALEVCRGNQTSCIVEYECRVHMCKVDKAIRIRVRFNKRARAHVMRASEARLRLASVTIPHCSTLS